MLFADAEVTAGASFVACLFAAITGMSSWLQTRERRLADKDRLDADTEKVQMKADIQSCKEDRDELRQRITDLEHLFRPAVAPPPGPILEA